MDGFPMIAAMIVGGILLIAAIGITAHLLEKKRTENLRKVAAELRAAARAVVS